MKVKSNETTGKWWYEYTGTLSVQCGSVKSHLKSFDDALQYMAAYRDGLSDGLGLIATPFKISAIVYATRGELHNASYGASFDLERYTDEYNHGVVCNK